MPSKCPQCLGRAGGKGTAQAMLLETKFAKKSYQRGGPHSLI